MFEIAYVLLYDDDEPKYFDVKILCGDEN